MGQQFEDAGGDGMVVGVAPKAIRHLAAGHVDLTHAVERVAVEQGAGVTAEVLGAAPQIVEVQEQETVDRCQQGLQELRFLVDIAGRAEEPGRPILYGTTKYFLESFGLATLRDLPRPDEIAEGDE